jgi:hypothetical protein
MDIEAFLQDLEQVLNLLPPDLVQNVLGSIIQHIPLLTKLWPTMLALMKGHVQAGIIANAAGTLDEADMQKGVMAVLQRYFVAHPPTVPTTPPAAG